MRLSLLTTRGALSSSSHHRSREISKAPQGDPPERRYISSSWNSSPDSTHSNARNSTALLLYATRFNSSDNLSLFASTMPRAADVIPDLTLRFIDNGRYQLIDKLGSGGFGVVYRGRERIPDTHRYVYRAIKVIPRATPKSHQANCQKREAYLHHAVSGHPNVVCLLNMTHDERYMYYIMEYCSGGDLHRAINKHQPFARNDLLVKHTFLQMLDAVEACHKKSVFHRDLKPENILLSEDGLRVKLCDFGLATQSRQSTTFKTGTYRYMSPGKLHAHLAERYAKSSSVCF